MTTNRYTVELDAPSVSESDTRRVDYVRKRVGEIDTTITLGSFEMGDLLAEVKDNDYWRDYKYETFAEYVKSAGIDISPRQAEYLVKISKVSKTLNIPRAQLVKARNSKLKSIYELDLYKTITDPATLVVESMADIMRQLVADAPNKTLKEIQEIVKSLKGEEELEDELVWMSLPVRRDAKQVVTSAIELAQQMAGTTLDILTKEEKNLSTASALELICAEFLADPNNQLEEFEEQSESSFEDVVEFGEDAEND